MAKWIFYMRRVSKATEAYVQDVTNTRAEPRTTLVIELVSPSPVVSCKTLSSMSSLPAPTTFFEVAIMQIPPKLIIIAQISNGVICSRRKHQPSTPAQNGEVLKMVYTATSGIIGVPIAMHVNPIVPINERQASNARSYSAT